VVNTGLLKATTQGCSRLARLAEREFTAFFSAVVEMFGPENAKVSLEEWLQGLLVIRAFPSFRLSMHSLRTDLGLIADQLS
jgi:plasmid stabilization system protein ParE